MGSRMVLVLLNSLVAHLQFSWDCVEKFQILVQAECPVEAKKQEVSTAVISAHIIYVLLCAVCEYNAKISSKWQKNTSGAYTRHPVGTEPTR